MNWIITKLHNCTCICINWSYSRLWCILVALYYKMWCIILIASNHLFFFCIFIILVQLWQLIAYDDLQNILHFCLSVANTFVFRWYSVVISLDFTLTFAKHAIAYFTCPSWIHIIHVNIVIICDNYCLKDENILTMNVAGCLMLRGLWSVLITGQKKLLKHLCILSA